MEKPLFNSVGQAVETTWLFTNRLCQLATLGVLWVAHLAAAVLVLAALWWFQVEPAALIRLALRATQSSAFAAMSILGVSALTAAGVYWWLLRKLRKWLSTALIFDPVAACFPRA